MFHTATSFNQDLSGWEINSNSDVVSDLYLIFERVLHCIKPQPHIDIQYTVSTLDWHVHWYKHDRKQLSYIYGWSGLPWIDRLKLLIIIRVEVSFNLVTAILQ